MGAIDVIGACGSIATVGALGVAVWDLRKARRWKRAEFVAGLFKDWEAQAGVRAALKILDYRGKKLRLADYGGRTTDEQRVGTNVVARALELPEFRRQDGQIGTASYTDVEHDIRDAFDQFFDGLDRFATHAEAGLVSPMEFAPYLDYWISRLGNNSVHDQATLAALEAFASRFHPDALAFLRELGTTFTVSRVQRSSDRDDEPTDTDLVSR